jgi:hypothetical protein
MNRLLEKQLGDDAEYVVKEFFAQKGYEFILSENKYDDKKDAILIANNEQYQVEIKLETRYKKFNSFTIPIEYSNQLSKCANVDMLIFCQRPTQDDPTFKIYQAPPVGQRFFEIKQNEIDKRHVAHFFIGKMKLIGKITNKEIIEKYMVRKAY